MYASESTVWADPLLMKHSDKTHQWMGCHGKGFFATNSIWIFSVRRAVQDWLLIEGRAACLLHLYSFSFFSSALSKAPRKARFSSNGWQTSPPWLMLWFSSFLSYLHPTHKIKSKKGKTVPRIFPSVAVTFPTSSSNTSRSFFCRVLHEGIFGPPWNQKDLSNLWVQLTAGELSQVARSQMPRITSIMISKPH